MKRSYFDLLRMGQRDSADVQWWTRDGVPRYCPPDPRDLSSDYRQAFVLRVHCQACSEPYVVEWGIDFYSRRPDVSSAQELEWAYGDPPRRDPPCCLTGQTMNTYTSMVLKAYRRKGPGAKLKSAPDLEGALSMEFMDDS